MIIKYKQKIYDNNCVYCEIEKGQIYCCSSLRDISIKSVYSLFTLSNKPYIFLSPYVSLNHYYTSYGEEFSKNYPINYCPFCGQKFEYKCVKKTKTINKQVRKEVIEIEKEEIELPLE